MVRKSVIIAAIGLFILVGLSSLLQAQRFEGKVEKFVYSEFDRQQEVPVIIEFDNSKSLDNLVSVSSFGEEEYEAQSNLLVKNMTKKELNYIISQGKVKKVWYNYPVFASMQQARGVVEADLTLAKQELGVNLTGMNQTICLIDTGVNYTHPDLGGCYGNNDPASNCKVIGGYDFVNNDNDPMDDYGHGTHVAGIAAGSGNLTGIAPDAKIVALKVLDDTGSGSDANVVAAIRWCTGNSSLLNISVISMSLGSDCYSYPTSCAESFCNDALTASAINNASGMNISVVIATGNNGNFTSVSQPACVENATRVGAVYDANIGSKGFYLNASQTITCTDATTLQDKLACYTNRGNGFGILLAPGSLINSTARGGGYEERHGTSMATPIVAGAIALIKQYLSLAGREQTPKAIEAVLNSTGKTVVDSSLLATNMTRINITSALLALDSDAPNITLVSPSNASASISLSQNFSCLATDLLLRNVTFTLWNSTEDVINQTNLSVSSSLYYYNVSIDSLATGEYRWSCDSADVAGNFASESFNYTLSITSVGATLVSPSNNSRHNNNQTFDCSASSNVALANLSVELWNSTDLIMSNYTNVSGVENSTNLSMRFGNDGTYLWNCRATTSNGIDSYASSNLTIIYDITAPEITVSYPVNKSWYNTGRFNVSSSENGSCLYSLSSGANNRSMNQGNGFNFGRINDTLTAGNYNVTYYCNDSAGNWNSSNTHFFYVDLTAPSVTIGSPSSNPSATGTQVINFTYNVSESKNLTSCALILDGVSVQTNRSAISLTTTNSINRSLASGSYSWTINCTDYAGNVGTDSEIDFTISAASSGNTGSGSGSGGGGTTPRSNETTISASQFNSGYSKLIGAGEKIKFNVTRGTTKEQHSLSLNSVSNISASLTLASSPQTFSLLLGDSRKFSLINSEYYDLKVTLVSLSAGKANIKVQKIDEKINQSPVSATGNKANSTGNLSIDGTGTGSSSGKGVQVFLIITLLIVLISVPFIILFWIRKKKADQGF